MELPVLTIRRGAKQRVSRFLLKTKTYCRVHNNPPLDINPQTGESSPHLTMFQNVFNIIFRSTYNVGYFLSGFYNAILNAFLGVFAYSRKASITFVASICPSLRTYQRGAHWTDLRELTLGTFMKI